MIVIILDLIIYAVFLVIDSRYLDKDNVTYNSSLSELILIYSLIYCVSTFVFIVVFLPNKTFLEVFAVIHIIVGFGAGGYKLYSYKYDTSSEGKWIDDFESHNIKILLIILISIAFLLRLTLGIIMKIYSDIFTQLDEMISSNLNEQISRRVYPITS